MSENISKANLARQKACDAVMAAVAETYPKGTIVRVQSKGLNIEAEVVSHPSTWWYQPEYIGVRNTKTGKPRWICTDSESTHITILS